MERLLGYLETCKGAFKYLEADAEPISVVIGNEACDLDSTISAIAYAFLLHQVTSRIHVPVLNIGRDELRLRPDVVLALTDSGVPTETLTFRDEIDLREIHRQGKLRLVLVDMNVLPARDSGLEDCVVEVMDHHKLQRTPSESVKMRVEAVGSCCSLVADAINAAGATDVLDLLAPLLHATIMMDTVQLKPSAGRATPLDESVVALLESRSPALGRAATFSRYTKAKFDVSGLTNEELLQKDVKLFSGDSKEVAISSVLLPLQDLISRPDFLRDARRFTNNRHVSALVIMTVTREEEGFRRELALLAIDEALGKKLLAHLESSDLRLSPRDNLCEGLVSYNQLNVAASRKQVAPLVVEALTASC